jgi:hypothetical protein
MSDITTNYIYLLQEREFIKTKEPIYKVGMTKKENHERFNQYPKGSVLLFQLICNDCKNIEKHLINIFKEKFIQRKDIGNEYFEGEYKNMIDIIYSTIHNEKKECEKLNQSIEDNNAETQNDEESIYQITTYEEWIKYNKISGIIITNKTGVGYLRVKGQLWRELYDKNRFDFDEDNMEDLLPWIENNQSDVVKMVTPGNDLVSWDQRMNLIHIYKHKETNEIISWNNHHKLNDIEQNNYIYLSKKDEYKFIEGEYNVNKIYQDIIKKCYVKRCDFYNLNYHEYACSNINKNYSDYVIINCSNFTFTGVDELISNKILTGKDSGKRHIYIKNIVNISIVNDILNSLISNEIKIQYKKLAYNLIVKQEEKQIIFYDYNECLLTTWIRDLLYSISGYNFIVYSYEYYDNKTEFKKKLKTNKYRCVVIGTSNVPISIETQFKDFSKLGFKNIIVCKTDKTNTMYNIENFRKYLHDNKEILLKCIKEENNYVPTSSWDCVIQHDDNIFYHSDLLLTNFFKWCCLI